jgi:iron(III) transport system substrate-binding protein
MRSVVLKAGAVSLVAALAVGATGCGFGAKPAAKAGAKVTADPSVKGSISVYTSLPEAKAKSYLALFSKEYPNVTVTLVRDSAPALVDKLIKEKSAPVADVVWHTPLTSVQRAAEASALAPYLYHPGQIDAVSGDFRDTDHPDQPLFLGTDARMIGFAVNGSKAGGNGPATLDDLADPKYAGQLVMPSINTDAGYAFVADLIVLMEEAPAWEYLDKVDKNVAYYTDDESAPAKAAADGSAGVGIGFDKSVVDAQNGGNAVNAVFPGPPQLSPWEMDVDALVNKPSPSPVAKTFLDWAISDAAMTAYSDDTPMTSVDIGAGFPSGYPQTPSAQMMEPNDFRWTADNHQKVVAEWMKRYGKKIQK